MPLTRQEAVVMHLWDEGLPVSAIACRTGLTRKRAKDIVCAFHHGSEQRDDERAIRAGSATLLAALQAQGMAA